MFIGDSMKPFGVRAKISLGKKTVNKRTKEKQGGEWLPAHLEHLRMSPAQIKEFASFKGELFGQIVHQALKDRVAAINMLTYRGIPFKIMEKVMVKVDELVEEERAKKLNLAAARYGKHF